MLLRFILPLLSTISHVLSTPLPSSSSHTNTIITHHQSLHRRDDDDDEDHHHDTHHSTSTGAIVGGVIGGVAVLAILIILALYIKRRRSRSSSSPSQLPPSSPVNNPENDNVKVALPLDEANNHNNITGIKEEVQEGEKKTDLHVHPTSPELDGSSTQVDVKPTTTGTGRVTGGNGGLPTELPGSH